MLSVHYIRAGSEREGHARFDDEDSSEGEDDKNHFDLDKTGPAHVLLWR